MNYKYQLTPTQTKTVALRNNSFVWPDYITDSNTVLFKTDVRDKFLRKLVLPYVKFICTGTARRAPAHYLERQNHGARYFNLTDLAQKITPGQLVKLSSNRLQFADQAEIQIFHNDIPDDATVLVIAPHPDDAEIAAFGFYGRHNSHIVTITAGEGPGRTKYQELYSQDMREQCLFKAKIRLLDSILVPIRAGIKPQQVVNLGYFNDTLSDMYAEPTQPVVSRFAGTEDVNDFRRFNIANNVPACSGPATWESLQTDLVQFISTIKPDIIVTPHPVLDKNSDHRMSTVAVCQALKQCAISNGQFLFYVIHSTYSSRYPYGSIHTPVTLPPNFMDFSLEHGIYSHPLSREQQINKMFALDNMHELRHEPNLRCTIKQALRQKISRQHRHASAWHDFYRKAVRSNELFFTAPFDCHTVIPA